MARYPENRPVGKIVIEMHRLPIGLRRVVVPHHRHELVHVGRHECVGMVKTFAAGPAIERSDLGDFVKGRVIPLAECIVDIAMLSEIVGKRLG